MDIAGLDSGFVLARLGIALGLGLLIGLEREYSRIPEHKSRAAGFRTHGLIALLGVLTALLAALAGPAVVPVALGLLGLMVITSYVLLWLREPSGGLGITSEVTIILTFVIGALVAYGRTREAVVATGATCVMLSAKNPMHRFVDALSTTEWIATMKFAVITLVVLPVLPNESYGPYHAFNPFKLWFLVVLISGISFFGYVLNRAVGTKWGMALTGLIGGLASSTAVTLANARRAREQPQLAENLALATVLACTVMLPRLLLIIAAVCPSLLAPTAIPFGVMLLVSAVYSWLLFKRSSRPADLDPDHAPTEAELANPFELGPALKFAAVFMAVTFLVKWARATGLGQGGIYLVSFVSGLVETDAIVVTLAEQASAAMGLAARHAVVGIVLAAIGNSLLKSGLACGLGGWQHGRKVLLGLLLSALAGAVATGLCYGILPG